MMCGAYDWDWTFINYRLIILEEYKQRLRAPCQSLQNKTLTANGRTRYCKVYNVIRTHIKDQGKSTKVLLLNLSNSVCPHCNNQSSSRASVLISPAPCRANARIVWFTAAISTAKEIGSWWSLWLVLSSCSE